MRNLHIIMPMAGEGSRFKNIGIDTPKPLIRVDNEPLFVKALNGIMNHINPHHIQLTFIVRKEHIDNYNIDKIIKEYYSWANIEYVEKTTRGTVETCLLAEDNIRNDDAVLVLDCDLMFNDFKYTNIIMKSLVDGHDYIDGLLLSFNSNKDKYSYAKVNENNFVIETAEKNPISNNALVGSYYFAYSTDFFKYAHELVDDNDLSSKEFYTSLLYNKMIRDNKHVYLHNVGYYKSLGTPEELKEYEENKSNNN